MSKKKKIIIAVIIAILTIAIIVGIVVAVKGSGSSAVADSGVYAQKVSDVMYQTGTVDKYSGVVEAAESVDVKTDSEKTVKDILVSEGDQVQVGSPLFTYDTDEMSAKRESAALELENLNNTLSGYDAQIEQLTKEKKEASKDQQLDYTLQIQQIQTQQKQTQYDITSKQAEIKKYDDSINNATVTSSIAGTVKKINENQSADQTDSAFMTIISSGDYRVKGTIDEQSFYYSGLSEGTSVIIRSRVDDTKTWSGTISKVDTENTQTSSDNSSYSDGSSSETASKYDFYVQLASSEDMLLGQHVFIELDYGQSEKKEGIWIDESYIVQDDKDAYVWVMNGKNKLEKRTVELGDYDSNLLMYQIKSGLSESDYIVWAADDLHEGEAVQTWQEYIENGGGDDATDGAIYDTSAGEEMLYDTEVQ